MLRTAGIAALAVMLAACGGKEEATVGGVGPDEAAALDNAAETLDASPDSLVAPEGMPLDSESNGGAAAANSAEVAN